MFGLFRPKCPLDTAEKAWVEWRMRWLCHCLGFERLAEARVILPTEQFFTGPYQRDEASARRWFDRMCQYMRVDPGTLSLHVLPDEEMPGAAGLYEKGDAGPSPVRRARSRIFVAASQLADPSSLLATFAHEIGHEILLGGGHLTADVTDHEQTTDLITVFLGVGVFNANATIQTASGHEGNYSWWQVRRQGYLSSIVLGYALAVFAHLRRETNPGWASHLRDDARETMLKGLRYLGKTGDMLFDPTAGREPYRRPTPAELDRALRHRSPTFRLAALWGLQRTGQATTEVLPGVCAALDDRDDAVRIEAARAVAGFGESAAAAIPRLLEMLQLDNVAWASAADTLGVLKAEPKLVVQEIAYLLKTRPDRAERLAPVLRQYGAAAAPAVPLLLDALRSAYVRGEDPSNMVATLNSVCTDPRERVRTFFAREPELLSLALGDFPV